ncbi:MAG TPA: transglutaminase domain-containing protein [Nitrospirota bacterium]|nr:transglutaminase domain-containing protein [Nitrospirota bacterium]
MQINRVNALLLLFLLIAAQDAGAGLTVLEGEHTVIYDIVNPRGVSFIPDYTNESFEQTVLSQDEFSKRVQVTARMNTFKTPVPFPIPEGSLPAPVRLYLQPEKDRQSADPSIVRLAKGVTQGIRSAPEAGNAILTWIADNLVFDTSISVPSDAVSALRHQKAYCVGYSNLAVAMLRAAGIPARVAHGYLPPGYEWGFSKEYWGVKVNDGGFHAYLEIFYPGIGWVFSDAEHSHHFVDPFHIILRLDGMEMPGAYTGGFLDVDKATFYTIFKEIDTTLMVDELQLPKTKRLGRRFERRQHAALVSGTVQDEGGKPVPTGTAVLWKDGRGVPVPFSGGRYAVTIQSAGKYRVEIKGSGFAKTSKEITVERGQVYRTDVTLTPGGVIRGRVVDGSGKPVTDGDVFYREGKTSYGVSLEQDGSYRIEGLAAGQYTVSVVIGEKKVTRQAQVSAGAESVMDFTAK